MDFYLYTFIIRIGTKLYIFHHIKIPTIISNIGFMIVHTGPCNTKNTYLKKFKMYMVHIYKYKCQFLRYYAMPILFQQIVAYWNISAFYLRTCRRHDNGGHLQ